MSKPQDDDVVMNLVERALGQPPDAREAWLRTACGDDTELMSQVWDYVQWNQRMRGFLLQPLYSALPEHQFVPGDLLADRFRIVREVAQGGMGIVYEATDIRLGRRVALKCARSGFHQRLPPEVRHASEISHPNVCKIFDIHTASTAHGEIDFLTMEFIEGETLSERLRAAPLTEAEAREIADQLCAGLAEAHRKGVIHGDLKSNNVILTSTLDGGLRAVITDFGLARCLDPVGESAHGQILQSAPVGGAPAYMAPELRQGVKPTPASDVYALGVVLRELVSGERPELSPEDRSTRKPPPLQTQWDAVLARCLDPDPARRFEDAGSLLQALQPPRSRRWWMGAVAAVVLAAVSGAVTYQRATAPKESLRLVMLPLQSNPNAGDLAVAVSRETSSQLARLKGTPKANVVFIRERDVASKKVDTIGKARGTLGATHVLWGTIARENGKVVLHCFLTDARTQANTGDWRAEYAPGEVHYAPAAIAGMVTASLRLPPLAIPGVNAAAKQNYLAGLAYTRRNSTVDKALPLLESAATADPDSPLTWAGLAEAQWFKYFITMDPAWLDRTSESLRQAQNRYLDLAPVHRVTGLLQAHARSDKLAEAEYQRAVELDPANGDAYRRLGQVYMRNGRLDEALALFKKAVELEPDNFKTYQDLGTWYRQQGNLKQAAQLFEQCVALARDEPDTHYVLGTVYLDLGRFIDAERELREAIGLKPTSRALNNLGLTLMRQGKDREAIPYLESASTGVPDRYLTLMNLGTAYRRSKQPEASRQAYKQSFRLAENELDKDPRDGLVRSRVAYLCARMRNRVRANDEIAQALSFSPEDTNVRDMAVDVYEALGRREDALNILRDSPESVLLAASRWPDLAGLHEDSRFKQMLADHQINQTK